MRKGRMQELLFLIGVILSVSFTVTVNAAETVKIGVLFPFSGGQMAVLGEESFRGCEIARIVQNEQGGLWGKQIEYVKGDVTSPKNAISECERLITIKGIKLITGTYASSLAYAASEVAERYKVIYWETGAVADPVTQRGFKYLFRTSSTASDFGEMQAVFTSEAVCPKLGLEPQNTRVAIVFDDSIYGTTVGSRAAKKALEIGLKVVATEPYNSKAVDFSSLIMRLKRAKPDVLLMTSYATDAILFWRQAKNLGFNVKCLVGGGGGHSISSFPEALGDDANYVCNIDFPPPNTSPEFAPEITEFTKRYKQKYGHPLYSCHSASVYTGMRILWEVLKKAGSLDPEAVRKAALEIDIPERTIGNGWGAKFAPPGHPMAGTNLKAPPVADQWREQKLWVVWPIATKELILPMPTWEERKKGATHFVE